MTLRPRSVSPIPPANIIAWTDTGRSMSIRITHDINRNSERYPGVGKSSGDYGRIEADMHQSLMLGLCRRLNYHISAGLYTQQKSTYFADFRYFTRRNFPDTWDDQIGGVFNLLKGEWFNASDKYIQAHFMYESPFVLIQDPPHQSPRKKFRKRPHAISSPNAFI